MGSELDRMSTSSRPHVVTEDDAVAYVKKVKRTFQDNKEKYDRFLEIITDFKAQRVDRAGVVLRVKELFEGHRHLISGFNTFLPEGYEITLPAEDEPLQRDNEADYLRAVNFVLKVKSRFQDRENVYSNFLVILDSFGEDGVTVADVRRQVSGLLHGHTDLLEEFKYFLPDENRR